MTRWRCDGYDLPQDHTAAHDAATAAGTARDEATAGVSGDRFAVSSRSVGVSRRFMRGPRRRFRSVCHLPNRLGIALPTAIAGVGYSPKWVPETPSQFRKNRNGALAMGGKVERRSCSGASDCPGIALFFLEQARVRTFCAPQLRQFPPRQSTRAPAEHGPEGVPGDEPDRSGTARRNQSRRLYKGTAAKNPSARQAVSRRRSRNHAKVSRRKSGRRNAAGKARQ